MKQPTNAFDGSAAEQIARVSARTFWCSLFDTLTRHSKFNMSRVLLDSSLFFFFFSVWLLKTLCSVADSNLLQRATAEGAEQSAEFLAALLKVLNGFKSAAVSHTGGANDEDADVQHDDDEAQVNMGEEDAVDASKNLRIRVWALRGDVPGGRQREFCRHLYRTLSSFLM